MNIPAAVPNLKSDNFHPHWLVPGGHLQTVVANLIPFRLRQPDLEERITTPDDDFLMADWYFSKDRGTRKRLAILCHGLESHSRAIYMRRLIHCLLEHGWNVLAWNYRGCHGGMNRQLRLYHSGATDDLHTVVGHALKKEKWDSCGLAGFSLGGNLVLKYSGERDWEFPVRHAGTVGISAPTHLSSAARTLASKENSLYMKNFLSELREKVRAKANQFPGQLDTSRLEECRTFHEFDEYFTAPIHGFASAEDYYQKSSAHHYIESMETRCLLINAKDDPFLSDLCHPEKEAENSSWFHYSGPVSGGHVGFVGGKLLPEFWIYQRCAAFLMEED